MVCRRDGETKPTAPRSTRNRGSVEPNDRNCVIDSKTQPMQSRRCVMSRDGACVCCRTERSLSLVGSQGAVDGEMISVYLTLNERGERPCDDDPKRSPFLSVGGLPNIRRQRPQWISMSMSMSMAVLKQEEKRGFWKEGGRSIGDLGGFRCISGRSILVV